MSFLSNIEHIEGVISKKCNKLQKLISKLNHASAGTSVVSVITAGSTIATTVSVVGIPISVGIGTISIASDTTSAICSKVADTKTKKLKKYATMLDNIHRTKASFEYVLSKSLADGISTDEFVTLQNMYVGLLKNINTKRFNTTSYINDLKQEDFLQNIVNIVGKK